MATGDRSSSLFLGQSWASWADKMSIAGGTDDGEDEKADAKDDGDSMKLNKKDMDLFGFCPSRDEFMLAQCEVCNMLIKPQALKRHTEARHGSVASTSTSSDQAASSKVLNSELAKTLSLPVSSLGKASSACKPPTKASLKQVPSSLRMPSSAAGTSSSGNANCKVNTSSRMFRKANTNPVVKMERIPKEVASLKKVTTAAASSNSSPSTDVTSSSSASVTIASTHTIRSTVNSPGGREKILTNGAMLKQALGTSRPVTSASTVPVTTLATQPLALTTTTTSITYTQPATATIPTTTATTNFAVLSRSSKPVSTAPLNSALAATLTANTNPLRTNTHTTIGNSKSKKSPKERKFLPCKDREFDANKHCGVKTEETGKPCTRSLTCKTHALGLRRAVPGRKKSFDDLLKEHKAAKEAQQKAKAEEQAAASVGVTLATNSLSSTASTLVTAVTSPAALAAVSAFKLGPEISLKSGTSGLLSHSTVARAVKSQRPALNAAFQKLAPGGSFPPSVTIKEESSPIGDPCSRLSQSSENRLSQSSEKEGEILEKSDVTYLSHHPRPAAVCTFGARMAGGGCSLFSRRTDHVRAAVHSALERQLNPPPHKKLCVESKLPKEPQMSSNSKDPYEFNMVDSGLAHQRQTVSFTIGGPVNANSGLLGKPLLKHKAKSLSSHSLNVSGLSVSCGATSSTIAIPTLAAALLKPTKGSETSSGNGSTGLQRGTLSLSQPLSCQSLKRKRSSGSQGSGSSAQSVASNMIQLQGTGVGLTVATGTSLSAAGVDGNRVSQQQSALLTPVSSVNSHCATTPLTAITIPSINIANAAALGLSATLPSNKQQGQGQKSGIVKDFNFVLTGIDSSSLVNGQYLNITGAQLAELAAAQAVNATAEDKNIKRSRLTTTKGTKISGTLETLRALQGSNNVLTAVPQNAVLVDRQGAVLAPVSSLSGGGSSGGNSAFVTLTTTTITSSQSCSSITVTPNTIFRTVSESGTAQQVTLTTPSFANGIIPSAGEKLHVATGSTLNRIANNIQGQSSSTPTAKTLQTSGLLQAQGTPICPSSNLTQLAHFKSGAYITKGGKITMQPMSVTIPLVSTVGLSTLPSSQQQTPQSHSHSQPTLLVTTTADDGRAGGGVAGSGKTEIHIQPHISSASSGVIS